MEAGGISSDLRTYLNIGARNFYVKRGAGKSFLGIGDPQGTKGDVGTNTDHG